MSNAAITIKFFASLREHVGQSEAETSETEVKTVMEVWNNATNNLAMPENTLIWITLKYLTQLKRAMKSPFFLQSQVVKKC